MQEMQRHWRAAPPLNRLRQNLTYQQSATPFEPLAPFTPEWVIERLPQSSPDILPVGVAVKVKLFLAPADATV